MTVEEFLLTHPDEDVDLQVPEGRILLDHGQAQQAEDLLTQMVHLAHQTRGLWRVSAAHNPKLEKPVRYWPKLKRGLTL